MQRRMWTLQTALAWMPACLWQSRMWQLPCTIAPALRALQCQLRLLTQQRTVKGQLPSQLCQPGLSLMSLIETCSSWLRHALMINHAQNKTVCSTHAPECVEPISSEAFAFHVPLIVQQTDRAQLRAVLAPRCKGVSHDVPILACLIRAKAITVPQWQVNGAPWSCIQLNHRNCCQGPPEHQAIVAWLQKGLELP